MAVYYSLQISRCMSLAQEARLSPTNIKQEEMPATTQSPANRPVTVLLLGIYTTL